MPLYNETVFLEEALASLLDQTYRDFRLVILDDSTRPEPGAIARRFAAKDRRVDYAKHKARIGLVDNWKACFERAGEVDYFAWVGDHDRWHPRWLETMVEALNARSNAVIVYPRAVHITPENKRLVKKGIKSFSTDGLTQAQRVKAVCRDAYGLFGDMVYGLFRAEALRRVGVFRRVLFPDVILFIELSFLGDIQHVDAELWYRRKVGKFSIARQKRSLFAERPWYTFLPWPLVNAGVLAWNTAVRPGGLDLTRRVLGVNAALIYLGHSLDRWGQGSWIGSIREWRLGERPWMKRLKTRLKNGGAGPKRAR